MKNFMKLMMVAILFSVLAACKKDHKELEPKSTPVTTDELLDYYITTVITGTPSLRVIYFTKDGTTVKATMDAVTSRRVQTVNVVDNELVFDVDGDGNRVYTFKLIKDDAGKVSLYSYTYKNLAETTVSLAYAQIDKTADALSFKGKTFAQTDVTNSYLRFPLEVWQWNSANIFDGQPFYTYYIISPGAWKGNKAGVDYMGISVPRWKESNEAVMLVQKADALSIVAVYKAMP